MPLICPNCIFRIIRITERKASQPTMGQSCNTQKEVKRLGRVLPLEGLSREVAAVEADSQVQAVPELGYKGSQSRGIPAQSSKNIFLSYSHPLFAP